MTTEKLAEILTKAPADIIKALETSDSIVPKWSDLVKQYDPMQHNIFDEAKYPSKPNETGSDDFKRTPLALQKLAVNRIAQAMFATPVERIYTYDKTNEEQQMVVSLIEQIYRVDNKIDSKNIERAKRLNASCQVATIWFAKQIDEPFIFDKLTTKLQLLHKTYSEMEGYQITVKNDEYDELLALALSYKDADKVEYFDLYTKNPLQFNRFVKTTDWTIAEGYPQKLEVFPVVYSAISEPVWGGDHGTALVEQLEEMESFQGLYIKRNSLPTFILDYGEIGTGAISTAVTEKSTDSRKIVNVGKGGSMTDVTWEGAGEAISSRYSRLRNSYFEQVQMPDISFANLINSNTSADNKELLFSDAKAKARDLGGEWESLFYSELVIVKKFLATMFPALKATLELITIRSQIKPYSVKNKVDTAQYVATAGANMSLETKVRVLNEVDDVALEVETIQNEQKAAANSLM